MHRLQRASRALSCFFTRAVKDRTGVAAVEFGFMIPIFGLMLISRKRDLHSGKERD